VFVEVKERVVAQTKGDVIDLVQEDHQKIKGLMEKVSSSGGDKEAAFRELVTKIAVHETTEEQVVHPLAPKSSDGRAVEDELHEEESKGKKALTHLEEMGVQSPDFDKEFKKVQSAVLEHAEHEEKEEHPRLRASADPAALQKAAQKYEMTRDIKPKNGKGTDALVGTFDAAARQAREALSGASGTSGR
jgi:hypothetical protein